MHGSKLAHILLLGALTVLPGCLAINAALGVLGVMGPPAAQLAGAAYTVAEYSYEYGANDRTPDEVFLAKFDWLLDDGDEPDPAAFAGALSAVVPGPQIADGPYPPVAIADAGDLIGPFAGPVALQHGPQAEEPVEPAAKTPSKRAVKNNAPVQRTARVRVIVAKAPAEPAVREPAKVVATRRPAPVHIYVAHAPDPLQTRLNRLENGLNQAEALYLSKSADGLRLSVPPRDGDPCAQGVSGGNSLRLPVMRTTSQGFAPPA